MYTPPHHIIPHHTSTPTSLKIQKMPSPSLHQSPSLQPIPTYIIKQMTIDHTFKPLAPHPQPPTHPQITEKTPLLPIPPTLQTRHQNNKNSRKQTRNHRHQTSTPSQAARAQAQTNPTPPQPPLSKQ
jgi:hypothetical protein